MERPRRPIGLVLRVITLAYIVALAAMPLAHHDVVCHVKSSTHCGTCHVGASADPSGATPSVAAIDFAEAGHALETSGALHSSPALLPSAGRAPPARS